MSHCGEEGLPGKPPRDKRVMNWHESVRHWHRAQGCSAQGRALCCSIQFSCVNGKDFRPVWDNLSKWTAKFYPRTKGFDFSFCRGMCDFQEAPWKSGNHSHSSPHCPMLLLHISGSWNLAGGPCNSISVVQFVGFFFFLFSKVFDGKWGIGRWKN